MTFNDVRTDSGTATTFQDGGSATVNGWLRMGMGAAASTTYSLAGGTLNVAGANNVAPVVPEANIGENGVGVMTIGGSNGGTMVVSPTGLLTVATGFSANGTLTLQSGGLLKTPNVLAGLGTGTFNFSGGTLQNPTAANLSVAMPVNLAGQGTVNVDGGQTATFQTAAALSGAGGLTKAGGGTLSVQSGNSYAGPTVINGGVLQLGVATPQVAYDFTSGSAVNTGNNVTAVTSTPVGAPAFGSSGGPNGLGVMALNGSNYLAITAGSLPTLSGSANYTLGVWINTTQAGASVLYKGSSGAWNSNGREDFYLTTTTPNSNNGGTGTHFGGVQFAGGWVGGNTTVNTGTWEFVSVVRSGTASTIYVNGVNDGVNTVGMGINEQGTQFIGLGYNSGVAHDGALMFSGSISGTYLYSSALTAAQIQSLYSAGPGAIHGSLPSTTDVSITASGAALDVDSAQQTVGSLSGVAGANVFLGGGTLTVGNTGSTTFAGNIGDAGGASTGVGGSLVMNGSGMLTLTGTGTYSGSTDVFDGTLVVTSPQGIEGGTNLYVGSAGSFFAPVVPAPQAASTVTPVPEPASLLLVAAGAAAALTIGAHRRGKQQKRN